MPKNLFPVRPSLVTLTVPAQGISRSFTLDHAERLLKMRDNGGWVLPSDSPYEYSATTGLRKKVVKAVSTKTRTIVK